MAQLDAAPDLECRNIEERGLELGKLASEIKCIPPCSQSESLTNIIVHDAIARHPSDSRTLRPSWAINQLLLT